MVKYIIIDTETTGLHIIKDRPFLIQYGLVDERLNLLSKQLFKPGDYVSSTMFTNFIQTTPTIVGHNVKFDIHMLINFGMALSAFKDKNYIDTMVLARLVINHDTQTDKTFSVALKKLATRYLRRDAADEQRVLKAELSRLTSIHKENMHQYFVDQKVWPAYDKATEETKAINSIHGSWNKIYHLFSPALAQAREDYLALHPFPTYEDCQNVETYAMEDIDLTHGLFKLWYPDVVRLHQEPTLMRISKAVFPLIVMERKGMVVDMDKVLVDRAALLKELANTKIIDSRSGNEVHIGQHAVLKELYEYESGEVLASADKSVREDIEDKSPAAKAAGYLSKIDKLLNTYITGVLNKVLFDETTKEYKIYTDYNLAGTITGRLSSDFQQFPKEPFMLNDGTEINIRSWFLVPKGDKYMFYFDYAQMELRLQCEWTNIVLGNPDINMARAFSPYKCIKVGDKYYLEEDPSVEWKPVDLHGLTAKHAFPGVDETNPEWKHYRSLGKRCNFACNYGASAPKIQQALKVDFPTAKALVEGYKHTFAGVVAFSKWVGARVYVTDNIPNLLLRRYYSRNKHQLQNWLVQGSGADILLLKTRELYEYIKDKPHWNFMISVHDEIGLTCQDIPEAQLKKEVEEIQSLMSYKLTAVDVTSDVEYTTTKWSEKDDWKGTL